VLKYVLTTSIGLGLMVSSLTLLQGPFVNQAQAALNCQGAGFPAAPSETHAYRTKWDISEWLIFGQFPIGAFQWQVKGVVKEADASLTCFEEKWTIDKVVRAATSNRIGDRGDIIPASSIPQASSCPFGNDYGDRDPGRDKICHAPRNINASSESFPAADRFAPVGLYGILKVDGDDLDPTRPIEESRSYLPLSWNVEGKLSE
jgi:hypothetical protein